MFNNIFNNCCLCVIFFSCVHMNINLNIIFFCLIYSRSKVKKCSKNNFYECQEQNVFDFEKYIKTLCICYMYLQASSLNLFGRYMVYVCVYTHSHLSSSSKVSTSSTAGRADAPPLQHVLLVPVPLPLRFPMSPLRIGGLRCGLRCRWWEWYGGWGATQHR